MAIQGMPLLSSNNVASEWSKIRAAAWQANVELPVWDGLTETTPNSRRFHDGVHLPLQPEVREFILDMYAANLAQAIGRTRALNAKEIIYIDLYGGLQSDEFKRYLLIHGVEVGGSRPNLIHKTQADYRGRGCDKNAVIAAADMILAVGGTVSQRNVLTALDHLELPGANKGTIETWLKELRAGQFQVVKSS